jgi:CBS domain-containing protein
VKARDVMAAPPAVVTLSSSIAFAAKAMCDTEASLLPVVDSVDDSRLQGLITDRDILERCVSARHGSGCTVRDHMTRHPLVTAGPDELLDDVLQRMESARVHRVPVVESSGRVVGIIARERR